MLCNPGQLTEMYGHLTQKKKKKKTTKNETFMLKNTMLTQLEAEGQIDIRALNYSSEIGRETEPASLTAG